MSDGIPVDSIVGAVLQGESELEVEVQHIQPVRVSQSPTVKVGYDYIVTQLGNLVLDLKGSESSTAIILFQTKC